MPVDAPPAGMCACSKSKMISIYQPHCKPLQHTSFNSIETKFITKKYGYFNGDK